VELTGGRGGVLHLETAARAGAWWWAVAGAWARGRGRVGVTAQLSASTAASSAPPSVFLRRSTR